MNGGREVMVMYNEFNEPDNTILKALHIIDPEGAFVPGTNEYEWLEGSLQSWMDSMTSDEVLRKSKAARRKVK